ncbi:hypothetical protein [Flavobacterium sp. N1994]|uniref:hypothetical protein n=1 Tax=Flavobacterium sp. N1994 TaxID=2986827 RepID=UPI0022238BE9|nr:hypothetical protein [Flavobacterium sp. N1994]
MKNFVFRIMALLLFSFNSYPQDKDYIEKKGRIELVYLSISSENEVVKYKFDSIRDLQENLEELLEECTLNEEKNKKLNSKIAIEFSLTISDEFTSAIYKDSLTSDYERIVEEAIKLQNRLLSTIK